MYEELELAILHALKCFVKFRLESAVFAGSQAGAKSVARILSQDAMCYKAR